MYIEINNIKTGVRRTPHWSPHSVWLWGGSSAQLCASLPLLLTLHSVTTPWLLETGHSGNIYTADMGKWYRDSLPQHITTSKVGMKLRGREGLNQEVLWTLSSGACISLYRREEASTALSVLSVYLF